MSFYQNKKNNAKRRRGGPPQGVLGYRGSGVDIGGIWGTRVEKHIIFDQISCLGSRAGVVFLRKQLFPFCSCSQGLVSGPSAAGTSFPSAPSVPSVPSLPSVPSGPEPRAQPRHGELLVTITEMEPHRTTLVAILHLG